MNPMDSKDILRRVKEEGFESVWRESANLLPKPSEGLRLSSGGRGVSHPLYDLIQKLRLSFLDLGFKEVFNPVIVDENEIYRQYGPEAPIILDRCYYLAALPRPDIGLGRAEQEEIEKTGVKLTQSRVSALQKVLRGYKKGEVDSDDLVERVAEALKVPDTLAMRVISDVFPEF
ncbi:MAG: O-phosphoserine--tRNA ligase, partial [Candidatus Bathyarchaeota archaeon]|nr:O-phosphoserine--tRNA ligase [Candidatus Bathyarchaeota archaeon]